MISSKWRSILFHPFVVGILISAIVIFLFARFFPRYSIRVVDEAILSNNGEVYYFDIKNDGTSEKLHYYHYEKIFKPTLYLYDSDNNFKFLWNFFESPLQGSKLFSGDYNNDKINEIFVYTQSEDSIFMYVLNPENDKECMVSRQFLVKVEEIDKNFNLYTIGLFNLDSDKNKELLFAINSANSKNPSKIYSFNIKNRQLRSSNELSVNISDRIIVEDINNDDYPEILIPNRSIVYNGTESQSELIVLDHNLRDLFSPIPFRKNPSQVTLDLINKEGEKIIIVLNSGEKNGQVFNNLEMYNSNGSRLKEFSINKKSILKLIRIPNNENNLFLFSGKELYKYNSEIKLKKKYFIDRNKETKFIGCPDFNCDLQKKLVFKNDKRLIILTNNLKNKASFEINQPGKINLTFLKSHTHRNQLSVQINNKWYLLDYYKNEAFFYSQIFYFTAFVFIMIIVLLLFNIRQIKLRKYLSFKTYESILKEAEENIVDEFSGIKDKLENIKNEISSDTYDHVISKIDDTFESFKSLTKKVENKELFYLDFKTILEKLIFNKQNKIKINHFIFPDVWNGIKPAIKEAVFNFSDNLIDYIVEIGDDIQLNAQFIKYENHINVVFEAEKLKLNEDKFIKKSFYANELFNELQAKFYIDRSDEYGTIINLNIPLSNNDSGKNADNSAIRVIIAEDHDVSLFGLTSLFKMKNDIDVVGTAKNGMEVLKILETKSADVVITDISMPGMDGIELSEKLKNEFPQIKIVVFTMYMENWFIEQLINNGAMAFVSKSSKTSELINALHSVYEGRNYYCAQFKSKFGFKSSNGAVNYKLDSLTKNETQIVKYFGENLDRKQIALKMQLNEETIDSFVANILLKLNAGDEDEIVKIAKRQKFISD